MRSKKAISKKAIIEVPPPQEFIVLASLENRRAAERMVASLGRRFRRTARKGARLLLVLSGNADGSLELTQSHALTVGGLTAALMGASVRVDCGAALGIVAMLRGTKAPVKHTRIHEGHVGSDEHLAHEMLAEAGPHSALVLLRCKDEETWSGSAHGRLHPHDQELVWLAEGVLGCAGSR